MFKSEQEVATKGVEILVFPTLGTSKSSLLPSRKSIIKDYGSPMLTLEQSASCLPWFSDRADPKTQKWD